MATPFEIPIDADFLVPLRGVRLASANLIEGAAATYVTEGLTGSVVLKDSDGDTIATVASFTYAGSLGVWYAAFDAQSLTEGATYTLAITLTAPVDDYRELECTAVVRGGAC